MDMSDDLKGHTHPLLLALFASSADAVTAARALRASGVPHERVSIVARSHTEEGEIATASGASPGTEIEDSAAASRIGELTAHFLSAMALVMPGIGPIVADGPLAAELAEAAGHMAGGMARALERAGLNRDEAEHWQEHISQGAVLVGAHVDDGRVSAIQQVLSRARPVRLEQVTWTD